MAGEVEELKALLPNTDLSRFTEDEPKLRFALHYATSKVNEARNYIGEGYDPRYRLNVIQGALDVLENWGGGELSSYGENGVSVSRRETPSWLAGIVPLARRVAR